jgi:hypothetical protein
VGSNPTGGTNLPYLRDNSWVHRPHLREEASRLHAAGAPFAEIYRRLGLSRSTRWMLALPPSRRAGQDHQTMSSPRATLPQDRRFSVLCVSARPVPRRWPFPYYWARSAADLQLRPPPPRAHPRGDPRIEARGVRTVGYQERIGCINVRAHWMHWPHLFPQHGPGAKQLRKSNWPIGSMTWRRQSLSASFAIVPFRRKPLHESPSYATTTSPRTPDTCS